MNEVKYSARLVGHRSLKHFLFSSLKYRQHTMPHPEHPYAEDQEYNRLLGTYRDLYEEIVRQDYVDHSSRKAAFFSSNNNNNKCDRSNEMVMIKGKPTPRTEGNNTSETIVDLILEKSKLVTSSFLPHPTSKVLWRTNLRETVMAWSTPEFVLFLAFSPFVKKGYALSISHRVLEWVQKEECNLFISNTSNIWK